MDDKASTPTLWLIVFSFALLIDSLAIIYVAFKHYTVIMYIMVVAALIGAFILFNIWNKDERTETAINDASRLVIQIFIIILSVLGITSIIISTFIPSVLWEIGATLVVCAVILIYLHGFISVIYAHNMS